MAESPKRSRCFYIIIPLFVITLMLLWLCHSKVEESNALVDEVEFIDSTNTYNKLYYSQKFEVLKHENKELYDSLKKYKDQVNHLLQFTYEKEYSSGKVDVKPKETDTVSVGKAQTFEYASAPADTFQYKLLINAEKEPNWYSIQARLKETFTIVNKQEGDNNHLTVETDNKGTVSDVTVFEAKKRKTFKDRFSVGPAVMVGYDPFNKNFGMMVGVGISYDLW